ncbi:MAG: dephospho-CoA kinase [Clostridia bacterium]|nr:dephospho-CoA kinase [Clostridia bacterium]
MKQNEGRMVVGITGRIASGKTNMTDAISLACENVIDADEISRALTADGGKALPTIREAFGNGVFQGASLDRKALAGIVFASKEKREQLENILHPMIKAAIGEKLEAARGIVFLSAPLLYECALESLCDRVWCAYVPKEIQLRRLMERDHLSQEEAALRLQSQMPSDEKAEKADLVIPTDGTIEESRALVLKLLAALKEAARDC